MEPILEAKKLNLWYGPNHALHDVSIAIPEHEITAFIGPSGCGKSTFLRTLNRMNDLIPGVKLSGEVDFHGQDLYGSSVDPTWLRKQIGMAVPCQGAKIIFEAILKTFAGIPYESMEANINE